MPPSASPIFLLSKSLNVNMICNLIQVIYVKLTSTFSYSTDPRGYTEVKLYQYYHMIVYSIKIFTNQDMKGGVLCDCLLHNSLTVRLHRQISDYSQHLSTCNSVIR